MAHRRISLLSIDPWTAEFPSFRPFNYSIRRIQAALVSDVSSMNVEVVVHDFRTDSVEAIVEAIEHDDPDLVGASTYVWSLPTFFQVARQLKSRRPDRCVVFGGPSARPSMFSLPPFRDGAAFVDALVLGDGEDTIREIAALTHLDHAGLMGIAGLSVPDGAGWRNTPERPKPMDLDRLASPFQLGLAPSGMTGHLETFRGCPFSCAFCEWGVLGTTSPVFSKEYLSRELRAIRGAKAVGVFLVDAGLNLNARAFRSLRAAEEETGILREKIFNCEFYPSHATDEHLEFLAALPFAEVGVGLQSYDSDVLKRLDRPFHPGKFEHVIDAVSRVSNVTIELIVGLPGDDPKSFRDTLERARRHDCAILVSHCLVLPDALMTRGAPDFALDFNPVTLKMRSCLGWSEDDLERTWGYLGELAGRLGGAVTAGSLCRFPGAAGKGQGAGPQRILAEREGRGGVLPLDAALPDAGLVQVRRRPSA